jgi:hypothetical protein
MEEKQLFKVHPIVLGAAAGYVVAVATSAFLPEVVSALLPIAGGAIAYKFKASVKHLPEAVVQAVAPTQADLYMRDMRQKVAAVIELSSRINAEFLRKAEELEKVLEKVLPDIANSSLTRVGTQVKLRIGLEELIETLQTFVTIPDDKKLTMWRGVLNKNVKPYIARLQAIIDRKTNESIDDVLARSENFERDHG